MSRFDLVRRLGLAAVVIAVTACMAAAAEAQAINHGTGFTGQTDLTISNNASITPAGFAQLTPPAGTNRGGVFSTAQVAIGAFSTTFTFHTLGTTGSLADGMGFCIQRVGPSAIGTAGGQLGYAGMLTSVFIKFDTYPNHSTTQIYSNGADPNAGAEITMTPNVDFHSLRDFRCTMNYDGVNLVMAVTDILNNTTFNQTFPIDIPTVIGGATAHVGFVGATGGAVSTQEVMTWTYASLASPTNLVGTAGPNTVGLTWNAVTGATSYTVLRGTTNNGPYTALPAGTGITGTSFTDTTPIFPNQYFYVVTASNGTATSAYSNQVAITPLAPEVTALPNSGLQTNEGGATTTFDIVFNLAPTGGGSDLTVSTDNVNEGIPSTNAAGAVTTLTGFTLHVPAGPGPTITVTVTGRDDSLVDGNVVYHVNVTATNMNGVVIPPVTITNNDNDVQGVTFNRTSGIRTSEDLTSDQFSVQLNRQPFGTVTFTLASSNTAEGTVNPTGLSFDAGNWNTPHVVTVTGVDDALLDFNVGYAIISSNLAFTNSADAAAFAAANVTLPAVGCVNVDNELIPELPAVWGSGCGLLGAEALVLLGLAALGRRRSRRT